MKYKSVPGVISVSVCGNCFLVTPSETIEINETTAVCWEKLQNGTSLEELTAYAEDCFEVNDPDRLLSDISDLLAALEERHLITRYGA